MNNLFTRAAEFLQPFFWLDFAGENKSMLIIPEQAQPKSLLLFSLRQTTDSKLACCC